MKKQMIVIAMMSMIVTLAGCAGETDISGITKNIPADSVTAAVTSAPDKTDAGTPVDSKADESKPDEKTEKKEKTESKSDEKKEDPGTPEIKPEEKTEAPTGKKVAAADVSEIVGEWFDFDPVSPRKITVNSDASYEIRSGNGFSGIVTSGTVTTETVNGVKKFSFIDSENGLWIVPFELACGENGDYILQTEDNPAYDTIKFFRNVGDPGNAGNPIIDYAPIIGTWYEEDADIGRTITVNEDGTYTANGVSAGTISYTQEREMDYAIEYYTFTDNERGLWYTFRFMNNSFPELISYRNEVHETVSFSREPSSVRSSEAMSKIVGTWYNDMNNPVLVVNADGTYTLLNEDGSPNEDNIVEVEIREGVEKYSFKSKMLGTWYVPFEVRNGGNTLVTEDNPVYGIISFHR